MSNENEGLMTIYDSAIRSKIYLIRGQQVMLDSDLADLYGYEVKAMNQQVKRNINRFPEDFMFQLTQDELKILKSQIVTSSWGGVRKLPYAFTEQGIYMLATVLKGEVAERQSIYIMRVFREMKHFIANNKLLFEKVSNIELKQLEYQKNTDERLDMVFQYIDEHTESEQKIFFDGHEHLREADLISASLVHAEIHSVLDYRHDIFYCQRLKVELVCCCVVCRNGFRIVVALRTVLSCSAVGEKVVDLCWHH